MSGRHAFTELTRRFPPKRNARVAARVVEVKAELVLADLRQARRRSQEDLARVLKVNQPAVAKLEKRTDMYVSNLRRYIEALGGQLKITAEFPRGRGVDRQLQRHRYAADQAAGERGGVAGSPISKGMARDPIESITCPALSSSKKSS